MRPLAIALFGLLCVNALGANPPEASFAGSWWGVLDVGAVKLRFVVKLRREKDAWRGDLASPDQGPGTRPIDGVTVAGDKLELDMSGIHARFEGTRTDGDHVKGVFTQGAAFPLELQRGEPPLAARPQEPKPPFPYAIERVTVDNHAAGATLGCTLTHPRQAKFPAVILITGSGPQDRDESILGHKPFWVLADALSRNGIGVLRCDDRGTHESTGDFARSTTLDFADDVVAELAWLQARPDVARGHIGLVGHSEGGLIAPIVASRSKDVGFLVLLAGTGLRGDEIILRQQALVARAAGVGERQVAEGQAVEKKILTVLTTEKDAAVARKQLLALLAGAHRPPAEAETQLRTLLSPWYRTFLTLDPRPYLQKVKVPVLALNGARDVQVPPAENVKAIGEALRGDPDVTVKELPGLNHLFQTCTSCSVDEYQRIAETMSPSVLQLVVEWIGTHTR